MWLRPVGRQPADHGTGSEIVDVEASFGLDDVVLLRYEGEVPPIRTSGMATPESASADVHGLVEVQAALRRVAVVAATGGPPEKVFDAVVAETSATVGGALVTVTAFEEAGAESVVVAATGGHVPVGARLPVTGDSIRARMWRSGRAERIGDYTAVAVPLVVDERLWGALSVSSRNGPLPLAVEDRLAVFAEIIAAAAASLETHRSGRLLADEQAALRRVAELSAGGVPYPHVLRAIVVEASRLFDDTVVSMAESESEAGEVTGAWRRTAVAGSTTDGPPAADRSPEEDTVARRVLVTGEPARVVDDSGSAATPVARAVGVPVRVEGRTRGALVVTGGLASLPPGTEDRLEQFAHVAATTLTAARSRDALGRLAREQAALRRVAELVARGAALAEVFDAVAAEASRLLDGVVTDLFRFDDGLATIVAARSPVSVGVSTPIDEDTAIGRLRRAGGPLRLSTMAGTARADEARELGIEVVVGVPVIVEGQVWGALISSTPGDPLPADTENQLAEFAELAAAAIANAENKAKLRASRARVVATADEARQRLQRDVHDGAQQRLVQTVLALKLGLAAAAQGEDPVDLVREALEHAERATAELRDLVHGILPAALSRGGLHAGIDSLVAPLAMPVDLDVTGLPPGRLPSAIEVNAYFVVAEALTNVVKHARATEVRVTVSAEEDRLVVEVGDDGVGGADPRRGSGLTGLADRVDALDGTLSVMSLVGAGTTVRVALPLPGR
jgi:signal transduction histidine kinase